MLNLQTTNNWLLSICVCLTGCSGSDSVGNSCEGKNACTDSGVDSGHDSTPDVYVGPCGCGPLETCFEGKLCIAKMAPIDNLYLIDQTEVTRSQYEAWLKTEPSAKGQKCSGKLSFQPGEPCMNDARVCQTNCTQHPQVCVDWCDAYVYCESVGKRLCGQIGGGEKYTIPSSASDPHAQWFYACSSGNRYKYPYGDTYEPDACFGSDTKQGPLNCPIPNHCSVAPVASAPGCTSHEQGFEGVFDLSGNVSEWEDSCSDPDTDNCRARGGNVGADQAELPCADESYGVSPTNQSPGVGFRCCSQ